MDSSIKKSFVDDTWVNIDVDQMENSGVSFRNTMTEPEDVSLNWSHLTSQAWSRCSADEINHDQTPESDEDFSQNEDRIFEDDIDVENTDNDEQVSADSNSSQNQERGEDPTRREHVISEGVDQNIAFLIWEDSVVISDLNLSNGNHNNEIMLVPES